MSIRTTSTINNTQIATAYDNDCNCGTKTVVGTNKSIAMKWNHFRAMTGLTRPVVVVGANGIVTNMVMNQYSNHEIRGRWWIIDHHCDDVTTGASDRDPCGASTWSKKS